MDNFLLKVAFALRAKTHFQIKLRSVFNRQAPCLILFFCAVVNNYIVTSNPSKKRKFSTDQQTSPIIK